MNITCKRDYEQLKIYVEGILHLQLKLMDLVGFQSWIHGSNEYYVEFYFTTTKFTVAYGTRERWISVLEVLDKYITVG